MMEHTLKGPSKLKQQLREMKTRDRSAMVKAVDEFQTVDMKEMKKRVPVDTGELQDSGYTETPVIVGNNIEAKSGFSADHAMVVHEDLEAFHRVGQAKYMESVRNESRPYFAQRVGVSFERERKKK